MSETVLFIGRKEALAAKADLLKAVEASELSAKCVELDPAALGRGWLGKMFSRRKLRAIVRDFGRDGAIVLLECPGDTSWAEWMVCAVEDGLKRVAVPTRLVDEGKISTIRSGVEPYKKLDTLDDLKETLRGTLWQAQKLASVV